MAENRTIPDISIKKLDSLFEAFSIVAEGTYVYLCDMKYDYSRLFFHKGLLSMTCSIVPVKQMGSMMSVHAAEL